jgi:hypothetical protein
MTITLGVICKKYNEVEQIWEAFFDVQPVDVRFDGEKVVLNAWSFWLIGGGESS